MTRPVDARLLAFLALLGGTSCTANPTGPAETRAPAILDLWVSAGPDWASITWTTDEPVRAYLAYGRTAEYGSLMRDTTLTISHEIVLRSLTPETTHYFTVESVATSGLSATASGQFTTTIQPTVDPTISESRVRASRQP